MAVSYVNVGSVGNVKVYRRRGLKNMSLRVAPDGTIKLSLPWYVPKTVGMTFVRSKSKWLNQQKASLKSRHNTKEADKELMHSAREYLPARLEELAEGHGFKYRKIRLSKATSRWASCSDSGTISLNAHLMRLPKDLIDYVLIHELCHTKQMNHSRDFWKLVENSMPGYEDRRKQLKNFKPFI